MSKNLIIHIIVLTGVAVFLSAFGYATLDDPFFVYTVTAGITGESDATYKLISLLSMAIGAGAFVAAFLLLRHHDKH